MPHSKPYEVGGRKFIPIEVDPESGCEDCAANSKPFDICRNLPLCEGSNFAVIYKEVD